MKTFIRYAAAATLAGALAVAMATPSQARHGRNAALIGGFAAGALIGAAAANGGYGYYGPGYGYYGPGYAGGPYGPCYWQRQRFWDGYGWRVRNVRVCG